ncbi:MAG: hypothetical protein ACK55I_00135, partial [bacterium]
HVRLLDLVDEHAEESVVEVPAAIVVMSLECAWLPVRGGLLPVQRQEVVVGRYLAGLFALGRRVLTDLCAQEDASRHGQRLVLAQHAGVAQRDRPGDAVHQGLDNV